MSGYSDILLDHFFNPRNAGRMADADVIGRAGTPGQGPFMLLYLKLEGERIARAGFQTYGCGPAIAAGSWVAERLTGAMLAEGAHVGERTIDEGLGVLPDAKKHCARIAFEALSDALTKAQVRRQGSVP